MIKKRYKIANKVVEIDSIYNDVHEYCLEYETTEPAEYSVTTTQDDINYERVKYKNERNKEENRIYDYSDAYLEKLAVYRKIAEKMIDYDTILFHGSVVSVDNEGYLFTAKSGVGKSTHAQLWRKYLGEKAIIVNDDKPLINISEKISVYGTPYNGKHRIGCNMAVQLKAICIITRSLYNHIEKITKQQAYTMLVQQVFHPTDTKKMKKTLDLIDIMADKIKFYKLGCNMDISAAKTSYEGMR